ncbi:MAG TPA: sensor histidine kinase [Mucilaginibacter sp.]|jgi:sensor histidine kinase YesM|nr:sensor histidine kinase [Mucilaginibacter sp.]
MNFIKRMPLTTRLQWLVWIAVFLIFFFSVLPMDGISYAVIFTPINVFFYIMIIYGNISLLFPRFWLKDKKIIYVILVMILLIGVGIARGFVITKINNHFYPKEHEQFTPETMLYYVLAGFLTYLLSFVFRIAIAYFTLKQQSEKMLVQKSQAELNLLKSQVQPHFLFNTLNNIYYEAYREAPRTAKLIERLSDIMRYFVDESPKDEVSLSTEIQFLENYIALEKIRVRHSIDLNFIQDCNKELRIPPMLLMTFVENIFKHGIDKSSSENKVELSLVQLDGYLVFQTKNNMPNLPGAAEHRGFGIENLRKRLTFLYGENFELYTSAENDVFTAFLKVPVNQ